MINLKRKRLDKYYINGNIFERMNFMLFCRKYRVLRVFKHRKWKWPNSTKARATQYNSKGECHNFIRLPGIPRKSLKQRSFEARSSLSSR